MIPLFISNDEIDNNENEVEVKPSSRTYKLDFITGDILPEMIDNEESIQQAAIKAIKTVRDRYLIYSSDYGCEVFDLIGKSYSLEYLKIEVPRLITEALVVDDRIQDCVDFVVEKEGADINVSFTIISDVEAAIEVEVVL